MLRVDERLSLAKIRRGFAQPWHSRFRVHHFEDKLNEAIWEPL